MYPLFTLECNGHSLLLKGTFIVNSSDCHNITGNQYSKWSRKIMLRNNTPVANHKWYLKKYIVSISACQGLVPKKRKMQLTQGLGLYLNWSDPYKDPRTKAAAILSILQGAFGSPDLRGPTHGYDAVQVRAGIKAEIMLWKRAWVQLWNIDHTVRTNLFALLLKRERSYCSIELYIYIHIVV